MAFGSLVGRNRRRYGGYIVHVAIVLFAIGVAGASAYDSVVEGRLARGECAHGVRVHGALLGAHRATDRSRDRGAGAAARQQERQESRRPRGGQELVQDRRPRAAGVVGGRDPHQLPHGRGSVRDPGNDLRATAASTSASSSSRSSTSSGSRASSSCSDRSSRSGPTRGSSDDWPFATKRPAAPSAAGEHRNCS